MSKNSIITDTKIDLLREGVCFEPINLFTLDKYKKFKMKQIKVKPTIVNSKVYDLSNEKNMLPSEILLTSGKRKSISKLRYNPYSSIELKLEDKLSLYKNGKKIDIGIDLVPYYDVLDNRINNYKVGDYVDIVGIDRISILFYEGCYNWNCGKACKFCDLHPKKVDDLVIKPTVNNLKEYNNNVDLWWSSSKLSYLKGIEKSLTEILNNINLPHKHLFFMAGNLPTSKDVWKVCMETLISVSKYLDLSKFDSYLNICPHDNLINLKKVKDLGIKQVQYNLEIANEQLFEEICPGKIKYKEFVNKLVEAVSIFGFGNVRSNFVFGLQDKDEMIKEIERLASLGIVSDYSIFQPKNNTPFQNKKAPLFEDVLYFTNKLVDIYLKYNFKPIFCSLSSRSSIVNEIYEDRCSKDI